MDKIYISFEAEPEIIADLVEFFNTGEIEHSDPVPVKSSADALDSPIGASELIAGLGLLTVAFSTL